MLSEKEKTKPLKKLHCIKQPPILFYCFFPNLKKARQVFTQNLHFLQAYFLAFWRDFSYTCANLTLYLGEIMRAIRPNYIQLIDFATKV